MIMSNKKYFSKNISPQCAYCSFGRDISGGKEIFCNKKGLMMSYDSCGAYKYDVLKRVPGSADFGRDYKEDDFRL